MIKQASRGKVNPHATNVFLFVQAFARRIYTAPQGPKDTSTNKAVLLHDKTLRGKRVEHCRDVFMCAL